MMLIKRYFSLTQPGMATNPAYQARREKGVWQRRFWAHLIVDEDDFNRHVDYIHWNPVKHGMVAKPSDWQYSSFRQAVAKGWYSADWGAGKPVSIATLADDYE